MDKPDNSIMVIFGASGDLTRRKLVPALFNLYCQNLLPERFAVLGVGRSEYTDDSYREFMTESISENCKEKPSDENHLNSFCRTLHYQRTSARGYEELTVLKKRLIAMEKELQTGGNQIFYLSVPPSAYGKIAQQIGKLKLNKKSDGAGWTRIVVEKPFGYDLESAGQLNTDLKGIFREDQIYRIDHYLGKETVQNVMALRFSNGIFEPLWNSKYIDRIEVTSAETIGIENRGRYYDNAGALRDMVQNHILQLVGLIAMEPPPRFDADTVRDETYKVFQSLRPLSSEDIVKNIIRGQYTASTIRGEKVPGYRQEKNVAADSRTETFAAMKFFIDNWRWGGVPFFIRTGKRLPTRVTEVVINFKKTPHYMFSRSAGDINCNKLVIRIQPDEGILLKIGMKRPGAGYQIKNVDMDFHYSDLADTHIPGAYERLLLDCMLGDATLYARADAVEACWKFVDPILNEWQSNSDIKVYGYPAGTWGPKEASDLFGDPNIDWRYPCRNLSDDGIYCEL
ncbi:MAG: glucose-6-phosphate dehydrogenase [candidate division Zixibacteria bacterium]